MNVLVTGADGFIGRHVVRALRAAHHDIVGAVRRPEKFIALFPNLPYVESDFATDVEADAWLPRLQHIDCVVNAVGIFRERGAQLYEAIHTLAPIALFDACARADVRRVIQISALGADDGAHTRFHLSKKAADDYLARLALDWTIVQPSLVYGPDTASTRLFHALASFPAILLPGSGDQAIQPIHVDDVAAAISALLAPNAPTRRRIALVGPRPITLREYLWELRAALGLRPTICVSVPMPLVRAAARVAQNLANGVFTSDAIDMLARGNVADARATRELLGREPRRPREFIEREAVDATQRAARLAWLLPLLRFSIALVWIASGIVSAAIYPPAHSYDLLARVGITGPNAVATLYAAALLDIVLGVAIYLARRRRWLWSVQIALILFYSAVVAWALPDFWLHPFGPMIKNAPMLAGLLILLVLDE